MKTIPKVRPLLRAGKRRFAAWCAALFVLAACENGAGGGGAPAPAPVKGLDYTTISRQAYIGGSVVYYPDDGDQLHLTPGAVIAVRLGYAEKKIAGAEAGFEYVDDPARPAVYGYIKVTAVSTSGLSFNYTAFSRDGRQAATAAHSVSAGQSLDLNGDGKADIRYGAPAYKRLGMEKAVYLYFESSKKDLHTAMFAVMPQYHPAQTYPGGIIGVSPEGQFIATAHQQTGLFEELAPEALKAQKLFGLLPGDYVLAYKAPAVLGTVQQEFDAAAPNTAWGYHRVHPSAGEQYVQGGGQAANTAHLVKLGATGDDAAGPCDRFLPEDFNNEVPPSVLYGKIPASVRPALTGGSDKAAYVTALNAALDNTGLLAATLAAYPSLGLNAETQAVVDALAAELAGSTADEARAANRWFLAAAFPQECPPAVARSADIAEVLQLVHFVHQADGLTEAVFLDGTPPKQAPALQAGDYDDNYAAYRKSSDDMSNAFKQAFSGKLAINLDTALKWKPEVILNPVFDAELGLNAGVTCHWGKLELAVGAGVFIKAEITAGTMAGASRDTASVFEAPPKVLAQISKTVVIGPVTLTIDFPLTLDLQFGVNVVIVDDNAVFLGFTGFWGANAAVGVDYSVKWKWGFIPIGLNFNPYAKAQKYNETVSFAGSMYKKDSGVQSRFAATVKPVLGSGVKSTLWGTVWGKAGVDLGFPVTVAYDSAAAKRYKVGIDETLTIGFSAGLQIDIKIWKKVWTIATWTVFQDSHTIWSKEW